MNSFIGKIAIYGRMIRFAHTVFALPFALAALILASWEVKVTGPLVFFIILAMTGARSAAMGFNRLVDRKLDAANPRTANRELPLGRLEIGETKFFVGAASVIFVLSAAMISWECFLYSFPVLFALFGYSYTKRFTWLSHLVLGVVIGLAPLGVWMAAAGELSPRIALLSLALAFYITGFDILYACQDVDYDRRAGLSSLPVRFGVRRALTTARLLHGLTLIMLALVGLVFVFSPYYLIFLAIMGLLFLLEHHLVKEDDLTRVNVAFFHVNSAVSLVVLAAVFFEDLLRRGVF